MTFQKYFINSKNSRKILFLSYRSKNKEFGSSQTSFKRPATHQMQRIGINSRNSKINK